MWLVCVFGLRAWFVCVVRVCGRCLWCLCGVCVFLVCVVCMVSACGMFKFIQFLKCLKITKLDSLNHNYSVAQLITALSFWFEFFCHGLWTEHPHTSHFLVFVRTHDNVSHDNGSRCQCASYHPCVTRLCVWSHFDPLFALFMCLPNLLLHPPDLSLQLPCGSVRS